MTSTDTREGKATPGPWMYSGAGEVRGSDGRTVAFAAASRMDESDAVAENGEASANARLIAAAPDMLAALKAAEPFLVKLASHQPTTPSRTKARNDAATALRGVRAAIAKAEGR